jgi:hypothetical protein
MISCRERYLQVLGACSPPENVVGATAVLLADRIKSPHRLTKPPRSSTHCPSGIINERKLPALYGCNVHPAQRGRRHLVRQALPLYGWQEDVDFSTSSASRAC